LGEVRGKPAISSSEGRGPTVGIPRPAPSPETVRPGSQEARAGRSGDQRIAQRLDASGRDRQGEGRSAREPMERRAVRLDDVVYSELVFDSLTARTLPDSLCGSYPCS
jgi:hypothetical protein